MKRTILALSLSLLCACSGLGMLRDASTERSEEYDQAFDEYAEGLVTLEQLELRLAEADARHAEAVEAASNSLGDEVEAVARSVKSSPVTGVPLLDGALAIGALFATGYGAYRKTNRDRDIKRAIRHEPVAVPTEPEPLKQ